MMEEDFYDLFNWILWNLIFKCVLIKTMPKKWTERFSLRGWAQINSLCIIIIIWIQRLWTKHVRGSHTKCRFNLIKFFDFIKCRNPCQNIVFIFTNTSETFGIHLIYAKCTYYNTLHVICRRQNLNISLYIVYVTRIMKTDTKCKAMK